MRPLSSAQAVPTPTLSGRWPRHTIHGSVGIGTIGVPHGNGRRPMEPVVCMKCGALVSPQDIGKHMNFHFDLEKELRDLEDDVRRDKGQ